MDGRQTAGCREGLHGSMHGWMEACIDGWMETCMDGGFFHSKSPVVPLGSCKGDGDSDIAVTFLLGHRQTICLNFGRAVLRQSFSQHHNSIRSFNPVKALK